MKQRLVVLGLLVVLAAIWYTPTLAEIDCERRLQASVYTQSAKIALKNKDYKRAEENLRCCLIHYPKNYQAHFLMGAIWGDKGQIDSMVYEFNLAREYAGDKLKKIKEEMEDIEFSLWEKAFNSGVEYINIADSLEAQAAETEDAETGNELRTKANKALELASSDFRDCTLIKPKEFRGWFNLGLAYDRMRDYETAAEKYRISEEKFHRNTLQDSTTDFYDTTLFYTAEGAETELFKEIKKKYKKLKEDIRNRYKGLLTALGGVYFELGEYEKTIALFRRMLGFYEEDLSALEYIGSSYSQLGDNEEALKWTELIIKKNPDDKDRLYNVGAHYFNAAIEKKREFEARLREQMQGSEDPNIVQAVESAKADYVTSFENGLRFINRVLELDPEDEETWRIKAFSLFLLERCDEAKPVLKQAMEMMPEDKALCQMLAECYRKEGDVETVLRLTKECELGK